ncbi:glutathione binding-like protein [Pseudomonas cichorii]|uniref:glutathione binding-like protein n=1 Tax=Pseudomonas cichorii TaxID=36746 RepID=UPI001C88FAEF|nr:glutathione binding-like protein [Pseudomonas cichorii]MBX8487340.1 glutathione S-transferase N-terminal domain-containing protein [Pseudomonas cichorii]MBX8517270.1 glutathione S-transferase N-terminal domain-containing protein [Pseudomonas cichorii]
MITLYYSPNTCSIAALIVLHETGLAFRLIEVDLSNQALPDGTDFHDINAKGYVPVLELEDGERITELAVILSWLADQVPLLRLTPENGTFERIRFMEALNFIATEMHKANSFLLSPRIDDATAVYYRQWLRGPYEWLDQQLSTTQWITGDSFTAADAYAYFAIRQARHLGINLGDLPAVDAFMDKIQARSSVQAVQSFSTALTDADCRSFPGMPFARPVLSMPTTLLPCM